MTKDLVKEKRERALELRREAIRLERAADRLELELKRAGCKHERGSVRPWLCRHCGIELPEEAA